MEFEKREEYSIDKSGFFFQISQDEFLHCSDPIPSRYDPSTITWMKGNKRTEQQIERDTTFGVVGNSFFFEKDKIIKKADLINDKIVFVDSIKFQDGIKVHFSWYCLHYFIERNNNTNVSFAIPINEDFRSNNGIKFNVSIDELKKYNQIHVHNNFLFGISSNGDYTAIRRYKSDSEEYLERIQLPWIYCRSVIFNNRILFLFFGLNLISVNMNDFSYEIMKTNLEVLPMIVGIDENGMVNVQSRWHNKINNIYLLSSKLPKKYTPEKIRMPSVIDLNDSNKKRIQELERRLEDKEKKEEELVMNKEELEKRIAIMGGEMTDLKFKYNKLLLRVRYEHI